MRRIMAVAVSVLTAAVAFAQTETPAPSADHLRLSKVAQIPSTKDVVLEFTFDSDVSQRLSELTCGCSRKQADGAATTPLAPDVKAAGTPTMVTVTLPASDLTNTVSLECVLAQTPAGGAKRTLMTTGVDLALRRELATKTTDLETATTNLSRWVSGVASAEKPMLGDVVEFPKRAIVKLTNANPCGRYQVKAQASGETVRISKPSKPGSDTHTLELTDLTPGKVYDIEFYQLDKDDQPIPSTKGMKTAGVNTPNAADKVAFTSQNATAVEGGMILQVTTSAPSVLVVDTREYDVKTGTGLTPKLGTPWEKDSYGRPVAKNLGTSFKVAITLEPGRSYQYRLHAFNADGVEQPTEWSSATTTLPLFDFTQPVEIAVTPVGFVVSWESSVEPDSADIILDYEDRDDLTATRDKPGAKVSMALGPSKSQEFLQTMIASRQEPKAGSTTKPPKPPKLVVQLVKMVATPTGTVKKTATRELRILLPQEKEETKAVMASLALKDDEKQKLLDAVTKTIEGTGRFKSGGTKFNWAGVFNVALKFLAGGL